MGGTTDITRTVFLGKKFPSQNLKNIYTTVLIGHLNLSILKTLLLVQKGTKLIQ